MILSSILLSLGLFLTSVTNSILLIYVFYSFLYTFFAGYSYKSLLTAIMEYYKEKSGPASGILLMGAGLTAFIFNYPMSFLIRTYDYRFTMRLLALLSSIITMLAALLIKQNPDLSKNSKQDKKERKNDISTSNMLKTSKFWIFSYSLFY